MHVESEEDDLAQMVSVFKYCECTSVKRETRIDIEKDGSVRNRSGGSQGGMVLGPDRKP